MAGFGAVIGGTTLAGCTRNSDDDNGYSNGNDDDSDNGGTGGNSNPQYSLHVDTPDSSNEIDLTDTDHTDLEIYVKRELNGETEKLGAEHIEITGAYAVRNHDEYSEEFLEEQGLYRLIQQLENMEERLWRIQKNDLIDGNTALNLQINFQDPEYEHEQAYNAKTELTVEKTPEETREDTWIQDQELYDQLRHEHIIYNELERGAGGRWRTWKELIEDVEVTTEDRFDLEELDREETLHRYAYTWIDKATEAIGGGGRPSGQANFLAAGLEHILDNVTAGRMNNTGHNTVILHDHDRNKTYHVETGRGGRTRTPPADANYPSDNPDDTPLWETENNLPQAASTLEEMVKLRERHEEYLEEGQEFEFAHNIDWSDDFLVDSMTAIREDTDAVPGLINAMQELALTTELSPSINYEATGTAENPEFTPV